MFVMIIYSFTVCMLKSSSGCLRLWWSETPAEPVEPQDEGLTALGVLVVLVWLHRRGRREGGREGLLLFTWPLQRMSLIHTCSSVVPGRVRCRQNKSVLLFVVKVILVSYEAQVFRHHGRINLPGDPRGRNDLWAPQITSESNIKLLCVFLSLLPLFHNISWLTQVF